MYVNGNRACFAHYCNINKITLDNYENKFSNDDNFVVNENKISIEKYNNNIFWVYSIIKYNNIISICYQIQFFYEIRFFYLK